MILGARPCSTISAVTLAPATPGVPTLGASPPSMSTSANSTVAPASPATFSMVRTSLGATRYCLPPVLMTAYIVDFLRFPAANSNWVTHTEIARARSWLGSARTIMEGTRKVNFADAPCAAFAPGGRKRAWVDRRAAFNDGAAKSGRPRDNEPPPGTARVSMARSEGQEVNVRQRVAPAGAFAHWHRRRRHALAS